MSWLERRSSGCYHVVFRLGNQFCNWYIGKDVPVAPHGQVSRVSQELPPPAGASRDTEKRRWCEELSF